MTKEMQDILRKMPALVEKTFPMPTRFHRVLPSQIEELSRLLTSGRGERMLSYLNRPNFLSAYLRYFLVWNLYRLCRILPDLHIPLKKHEKIIDLGSGPLTFVIALWISRPDLRDTPLEFFCIDRSATALEAGKKLFTALSGSGDLFWKINLVREDINLKSNINFLQSKDARADLVSAVNLFNEIYESIPHINNAELRQIARNAAKFMDNCAYKSAPLFVVEPGVPQSGRFINYLRSSFIELERPPESPCLHSENCPFPGGKQKWCHFAFDTNDVPKDLHILSASAGLPKERLVLSYLLAGPAPELIEEEPETEIDDDDDNEGEENILRARVISDAFPLPLHRFGRYCCSSIGLVLLAGEKDSITKIEPGSVVIFEPTDNHDIKSGALIVKLIKVESIEEEAEKESNE